MFQLLEVEGLLLNQLQNTTWGANDNMWLILLQGSLVSLDGNSTEHDGGLHIGQIGLESVELVADLESQLSCMAQYKGFNLIKKDVRNVG